MATNAEIISRALRELNVIAETDNASAEQGRDGVTKLNGMMSLWREQGIDMGYYDQTSSSGTCPIPVQYENHVSTNLAIAMASQYGATVSQELATVANAYETSLLRKAINNQLAKVDLGNLPRGAGQRGTRYNIDRDSI